MSATAQDSVGAELPFWKSRNLNLLVTYFGSGWAFLIPYVVVYLVYAWLRWPVNVATKNIVPLTHIFWVLHGIHVFLALVALRLYLAGKQSTGYWSLLPWCLLGLLIWIPGVYLELPADPWSHFARINQWNNIATPLDNPEWGKSGSFFAYSWIGDIASSSGQLTAFNFFYLTCSLLYYWQYFRLGRALKLSECRAFIAVLVNFLVFGNNIFGFHRYYGMSTTVLAQIGILAFSRILILQWPDHSGQNKSRWSWGLLKILALKFGFLSAAIVLIGVNHLQGLLIVGAVTVAVALWRLTRGSRTRTIIVISSFVMINGLVVLLWPRHANFDAMYRSQGWITPWYGFNFFATTSPAFERAVQILGLTGVLNLGAGLFLISRREALGWLTVTPVLLLSCPVLAIPFIDIITRYGPAGYEYIATFHRLLLGIPAGMALCALTPGLNTATGRSFGQLAQHHHVNRQRNFGFACFLSAVLLPVIIPASYPFFNRFWHQIMQVPSDLGEQGIIENAHGLRSSAAVQPATSEPSAGHAQIGPRPDILSTPGIGFVIGAFGEPGVVFQNKWMLYPTPSTPVNRINLLQLSFKKYVQNNLPAVIILPSYAGLFSSQSNAGYLSGHWLPQHVALEQSGGPDIKSEIAPYYTARSRNLEVEIYFPK